MGNKSAKPKNAKQKEDTCKLQTASIHKAKNNVHTLKAQTINAMSSDHTDDMFVMEYKSDYNQVLQATLIAEEQLDRGGKNLTKADLVAIIVNLQSALIPHLTSLNQLSCDNQNNYL